MNSNGILHGQNIMITGASRGIGAGIAKLAAASGARVAITYATRPEAAEQTLSQLSGSGHIALRMDISDEASVEACFSEVMEKFGRIDGLVNNAGVTKDQLILRMKTVDFDTVVAANLRGTFLCCRTAVKLMLKAKQGSVVNITSVVGQTGNAGQSNYAASKAGVEALTRSIAQEVGSRGIRLNCVAPGFIVTEMTDVLSEQQKQAILAKVPLQSLGSVEDVAHAVVFMLSNQAKYITGQTLSVNGGMFMN